MKKCLENPIFFPFEYIQYFLKNITFGIGLKSKFDIELFEILIEENFGREIFNPNFKIFDKYPIMNYKNISEFKHHFTKVKIFQRLAVIFS